MIEPVTATACQHDVTQDCPACAEETIASLKARIQELEATLRKVDEHLDNFGYAKNMKARKTIASAFQPK